MNYLNFKKQYPKSLNKFFCWVSEQNPNEQNDYVDNIYFYQFFSEIFEYHPDFGVLIENQKYLDVLNPILSKTKEIDNDYWENRSKILMGKYSDTGNEFIQIRFHQESDYENAFYVLEILINKGLYA